MKNNFVPLALFIFSLTACSRHITPHTSNAGNTTVSPVYTKPIVIIDGKGNILVNEKDLPQGASKSILNIQNARAFTPEQTNRLAFRYKIIPPKVLYVPDNLSQKSPRGTYYVYNKKFWFWKKSDGYFYLDENYYK